MTFPWCAASGARGSAWRERCADHNDGSSGADRARPAGARRWPERRRQGYADRARAGRLCRRSHDRVSAARGDAGSVGLGRQCGSSIRHYSGCAAREASSPCTGRRMAIATPCRATSMTIFAPGVSWWPMFRGRWSMRCAASMPMSWWSRSRRRLKVLAERLAMRARGSDGAIELEAAAATSTSRGRARYHHRQCRRAPSPMPGSLSGDQGRCAIRCHGNEEEDDHVDHRDDRSSLKRSTVNRTRPRPSRSPIGSRRNTAC